MHDLAPLERARVTWIRESFDDGVPGAAAGARRLADVAEQTAAAGDRELALDLLGGAALRCWWGDPDDAIRRRLAAIADRLAPDSGDPRAIAILALGGPDRRRPRGDRTPARARPATPRSRAAGCGCTGWRRPPRPTTSSRPSSSAPPSSTCGARARRRCSRRRSCCAAGRRCTSAPGRRRSRTSRRARGSPRRPRSRLWRARGRAGEAMLAGLRGDRDGAHALAAQIERVALPGRATAALADLQLARGTASLAVGEHAEAYDALARLFDPADPAHHYMKSAWAVGDLAEAAAHAGREHEAAEALRARRGDRGLHPGPARAHRAAPRAGDARRAGGGGAALPGGARRRPLGLAVRARPAPARLRRLAAPLAPRQRVARPAARGPRRLRRARRQPRGATALARSCAPPASAAAAARRTPATS